jgi:hypothetical protein
MDWPAVAIAEKAAAGKAIRGGLVTEGDQCRLCFEIYDLFEVTKCDSIGRMSAVS